MRTKGFSLIELLIVVAILGILVAIAVPAYNDYVTAARRSDGQATLLDLANRMERFFTTNNTYVGASLAAVSMPTNSPEGFYTLSITSTSPSNYVIQAAPAGAQTSDTICGTLTYNALGIKGETGSGSAADCW